MKKSFIRSLLVLTLTLSFLFPRGAGLYGQMLTPFPSPTTPVPESFPQSPEAPEAPAFPEPTPSEEQAVELSAPSPAQEPCLESEPEPTPTPTPTVSLDQEASPVDGEPLQDSSDSQVIETSLAENQVGEGIVGETLIETSDAASSATIITQGNDKTTLGTDQAEEVIIIPTDQLGGEVETVGEETVLAEQGNQVEVRNDLNLSTNTGSNSASLNMGDSTIKTGDANTSATVVTGVNTNLQAVSVEEFNVNDSQTGDLVLGFPEVSGSGAVSAETKTVVNEETFQNNEVELENNLVLVAETGQNSTSQNTSGNNFIETGDANTSANVISFLNNNLAGEVVVGVVNIFGELLGDIILPSVSHAEGSGMVSGLESGNDQSTQSVTSTEEQVFQTNEVELENNLVLVAETGQNETSGNTGGQNLIVTGNSQANAESLTLANNNFSGQGVHWLVIVNELGEWVGKIFGAEEGDHLASSVNGGQAGETNEGQASGSVLADTSVVGQAEEMRSPEQSSQTSQSNLAKITNNITLIANTGGNQANDNTGGDSVIKTGEARVLANIVTLANNNLQAGNKLVIALVNVFGRWWGDFLPPGYEKESGSIEPSPTPTPAMEPTVSPTPSSPSPGLGEENDSDSPQSDVADSAPQGEVLASQQVREQSPNRISLESGKGAGSWPDEVSDEDGIASAIAVSSQITPDQKRLKVNLAWLTLTLPLFAASAFLRRVFS